MKTTVYEMVTERIVAAIENGVAPWHKPWVSVSQSPRNAVSGKDYRGVNVFLLACSSFVDPRWLTFNQAKALGGNVKRGESGMPIVFWKWVDAKVAETVENEEGETIRSKKVPILRYYTVFNVEQCEGLDLPELPKAEPRNDGERLQAAENILQGMKNPPCIRHGSDRACYSPDWDTVSMPNVEASL